MSEWYQSVAFQPADTQPSDQQPELAIVALDNWALTKVSGDDTKSYLQGQLTCDIASLGEDESTLAAHCDPKGKVWSVLRFFHFQDGLAMVQPASIEATQLQEVKKYAIFSKIAFEKADVVLLGIVGAQADKWVAEHFGSEGNVRQGQSGTAVCIAPNRWLLAVDTDTASELVNQGQATLLTHEYWDKCDIDAALPRIEQATSGEFIPQSLNLQALNAISFTKGCYTGQETVARAKYRGINKRAMYKLSGHADHTPAAGDKIERAVGDNWRSGGTVIAGYREANGRATVLAVLPNNLDDDTAFRLAESPSYAWQRDPLPYSLEDDD
ncbi:tRNA-modifying protein YgfZ [Salinivibrio sharmensis]|uniref:tRNA-modifying protein YgfZ n=1 Tax=Salinivibrio sharmensis TaxID=390883 RepID=A0ABX3KKA1_9GAMM|nr:tRNA-modifying protein YgfZ [Salinivibrio sharmensis]OOE90249.1 tRNA-modifying protein YgfZ [Salinivibrio sharmensis]